MTIQNTMTFAAIGAALLLLARAIQQRTMQMAPHSLNAPNSPVASMVADTLHQHEGEESPFVHAFEEALEHKAG